MKTNTLKIESQECEAGSIIVENGKTLASGKFQSEFIKDRIEGFLISSIPPGRGKVKIEINVTRE